MRSRLLPPALLLLLSLTGALGDPSLHAYIPATHKNTFDAYNVVVLGDLSVAKAAFRGAVAVQGKADLSNFDINLDAECDSDTRALTVGGALSARMGSIHAGYTVLGPRSSVHHSVKMDCSTRVERYDVRRNDDLEFVTLREALIRETADMCVSASVDVPADNGTMRFSVEQEPFSCYDHYKVKVDDLRLVKNWVYEGDYERNVVIVLSGVRHDFREFRMEGFNPSKTIIVFCAVYGTFGFYSARLQGSMLAPTSAFTTMDTVVNGSMIVSGLRGSLATLKVPYMTC